jgi:hypothetical protein
VECNINIYDYVSAEQVLARCLHKFSDGCAAVVLFLGGECLFLFAHEMNKSLLLETWINWMIRFGKVNCSVLSGPTAVRDAVGLR